MRKLLILLVAGLFGTASLLHAQVPIGVQKVTNHSGQYRKNVNTETPCPNQAGTFDVGAFTGQSNDTDFPTLADTIFLCYNDQLLLDHNGNFNLLGDPDMSTAPGVVWAFHQCAPTVSGPTLDDITAATNACLWPNGPAPGNIWVARDQIGGDILLNNQGQLQNNAQFNPGANQGKPVTVILAPVTIDNFNGLPDPTYEPIAPGFPPGPCVNLNINDWVRVAYLNPIQATGLSSNAGNDCIGRFRVEGGYPELVAGARYTIDISLASNSSVKGVLHLPSTSLTYFANVSFSVPQSGTYNISISDGKSCSFTGQINMTTCNPSDNVVFTSPDVVSPPNSSVCIPVLSQNLDILAAGFSINWDASVLDYDSITGINPILTAVNPTNPQDKNDFVVSDLQSTNGALAFSIINTLGNPISVPDNDTLFYICYTVIAPLGECTPLEVTSDPAQISFENAGGALALTDNLGTFCVNNIALSFTTAVIDSTCQTGMGILVVDPIGGILPHEVVVRRVDGMGTTPNGTLSTTDATFTTNVGVQNTPIDYEICVTDDNGQGTQYCDTITVFIPTFGAQLVFTQEPTCFGDSDGIITVNILENGTLVANPGSNYSYAWSLNGTPVPNATGRVLVGAASGNYQVVVTDNLRSCNFSASGLLGQPQQVRRQTLTATPASCLGINDGVINMQAQGGTPGYTYDWTYAPDQTSATSPAGTGAMISNLLAGFYRVTVSDSRGCTGIDSVSVNNLKTVDVAGNSTNTLCFGDNTGTVIVNVSESPSTPGASYTFVWTPGGFTETSTGNSSTYADLPAG
ncbi:MAG: SprB repeat-containing protein, partial [Saprospiraceae bacterium]|nr:SprB repeat-containing protein [Saprospiraceae bacterium]